ncbi:MAG: lipid-binding SYLF domain-containing protein [Bacillota bacterium]
MMNEKCKMRVIVTACSLALLSLSGLAAAQTSYGRSDSQQSASQQGGKAQSDAMQHVNDAANVVKRMENEPGMNKLLQQAKGVFIVPEYGRAALGVGGAGGAGVLLAKNNGTWSEPAFYNIGSISVGAQAGAEGGPIAMVLMNEKAVNSFKQKNNFALSADAGLTVVDWSKVAQGEAGTGDIVAWSGTKGLFGSAAIGVQDIRYNQAQTSAYYRQSNVAAIDVLSGKVSNPHADVLKQALAATSSGTATGSSGTMSGGGGAGGGQGNEQSGSSPSGTSDSNK